jgi:hypothetical protein
MDRDDAILLVMGSCFSNYDCDEPECQGCMLAKHCKAKTMDDELARMQHVETSLPEVPS